MHYLFGESSENEIRKMTVVPFKFYLIQNLICLLLDLYHFVLQSLHNNHNLSSLIFHSGILCQMGIGI